MIILTQEMDINLMDQTSKASLNSGSEDNYQTLMNSDVNRLAKPLYLQRLENALRLDGLIAQVERTLNHNRY